MSYEVSASILIERPILDIYRYLEDITKLSEWVPLFGTTTRVEPPVAGRECFDAQVWWGPFRWVSRVEILNRVPGRSLMYQSTFPPQSAIWELQSTSRGTIVKATHVPRLWRSAGFETGNPILRSMQNDLLFQALSSLKNCVERAGSVESRRLIFFCYRRKESRYVGGRIFDALCREFGYSAVFRDIDSILGGDHAADKVFQKELTDCKVAVVLIGKNWEDHFEHYRNKPEGDWVVKELKTAFEKKLRVIPLLVDRDPRSKPDEQAFEWNKVPESVRDALKGCQYVVLRPDPDFNTDMDRVIRSIWDEVNLSWRAEPAR